MRSREIAEACGFRTAKECLAVLKALLHRTPVGMPLDPQAHALLASLYAHHPEFRPYDPPEKFSVVINTGEGFEIGSRGFMATFGPGAYHRFSYKFDQWGKLDAERAARMAVHLRHGGGKEGGEELHHEPPWTFKEILAAWLRDLGREPNYAPVLVGTRFTASDEAAFLAFHDARATLRALPVVDHVDAHRTIRLGRQKNLLYLEGNAAISRVKEILTIPGCCSIDFETFPTAPSWHIEQAVAEAPRGKKGEARKQATLWAAVNGQAKRRQACTLQVRHEDGEEAFCRLIEPTVELPQMFGRVAEGVTLCAHNAQFETEVLLKHGVAVDIECTLLAAKALYLTAVPPDEPQPQSFSLAALVWNEFGRTRDKTIRDRDWRLEESLDEEAIEYGLQDVRDCLDLWQLYRLRLVAEGLWEGYEVIARAILPTASLNFSGLMLDEAAHERLIDRMRTQAHLLEHELDRICGEAIDIHSAPQISDWIIGSVLQDGLSMLDLDQHQRRERLSRFVIALIARTAGACKGWKLTEKTGCLAITKGSKIRKAEQLLEAFPQVSEYLVTHGRWKKAQKLIEAFGAPLRRYLDDDGRVRGQLRVFGTWTGRHTATDPNIQQAPREKEFRALWIAPPGRRLAVADYNQIELRLAAIESGDARLREVYREGRDVHTETAAVVTVKTLDQVTEEDRQIAKGVNFLSIYGGGAVKLAETIGCSVEHAQMILARFFRAYTSLSTYREEAAARARAHGYIAIRPHRRVLYIEGTSMPTQAINAPIQGGAASVQMRAERLIYDALSARPDLDTFLAASVHDEFLIEGPEDERIQEAADILVRCMAQALLEIYPEAEDQGVARLSAAKLCDSWAEKK